jgi:hypothetical protein
VSPRRRYPLAEPVALAARQLKQCETELALLDRTRPRDLPAERARLAAACSAGHYPPVMFEYQAAPELSAVRHNLERLRRLLSEDELEPKLLRERAGELELEAQLVEAVGTPAFRALAARRFVLPSDRLELHEAALRCLDAAQDAPASSSSEHFSDDKHDPLSLWSLLVRRVEGERLPVRIEVMPGLVSLAAVADGVVRVRAGARLSRRVAERIALHEIEGHVRPRLTGQQLGGVFLAGSVGATEDEEGRAILLEERAGLLATGRRRELGLRYLAAESVRDGADFWHTVRLLVELGSSVLAAVELGCRVHRGGGLARELVYLAGYRSVAGALSARPELEALLASGRVSCAAAASLLDAGSVELDDDGNMV